jgi:hypothetical protein
LGILFGKISFVRDVNRMPEMLEARRSKIFVSTVAGFTPVWAFYLGEIPFPIRA